MNQIYRCIWNELTRTWVAAAETTRSRSKNRKPVQAGRAVLLAASSLLGGGAAWAACGDSSSGGNGIVFASGGDSCDATHTIYVGTNAGYANGDGSVLTFTQPDVTINSVATNVHVLSSGGANTGGIPSVPAATVHATGNLTVNASATSGTTRAVYVHGGNNTVGERSKLLVDGDFTATRGTGAAAVQNAGGHIEVRGDTRITTEGADAFRNTSAAATNVFHGTASFAVTAPGGIGNGINNVGAIEFKDALTVSTTGGTAITAAGGVIDAQKGAAITTTEIGSVGLELSGSAEFRTGKNAETRITTAGSSASGIVLASTAAQGVTLDLGGPLHIETLGARAHGIYVTGNPNGGLTVPEESRILVKGEDASGISMFAGAGDLTLSIGKGSRIEAQGDSTSSNAVDITANAGKVNATLAGELQASGNGGFGLLITRATGGATVSNTGSITALAGGAVALRGLGGDVAFSNSGKLRGYNGVEAEHLGSSGSVTLRNSGEIMSQNSGIAVNAANTLVVNVLNEGANSSIDAENFGIFVRNPSGSVNITNQGRITTTSSGNAIWLYDAKGAATVTNSGVIQTGEWGSGIDASHSGTNAGSLVVQNIAGGSIQAGDTGIRVSSGVAPLEVHNKDTAMIAAGTYGIQVVEAKGGVTVSNEGRIVAGEATNSGAGIGVHATILDGQGRFTNSGSITANVTGLWVEHRAFGGNETLRVDNSGSIVAVGDMATSGVYASTRGAGLEIHNAGAASRIEGATQGVDVQSNFGGSVTMLNEGSITGRTSHAVSAAMHSGGNGAFINAGQLHAAAASAGLFVAHAGGIGELNIENTATGLIEAGRDGVEVQADGQSAKISNHGRIVAGNSGFHLNGSADAELINTGRIEAAMGSPDPGWPSAGIRALATGNLQIRNSGSIQVGALANGLEIEHNGGTDTTLRIENTAAGGIQAGLAGISASASGAGMRIDNAAAIVADVGIDARQLGSGALALANTSQGRIEGRSVGIRLSTLATGTGTLDNNGLIQAPEALNIAQGVFSGTNAATTGHVHGTIQTAKGATFDLTNSGLWTNTGNSLLTSVTLPATGNVVFTAPTDATNAGAYKTITVTHWVGQGGLVHLNTWLGDDSSPSDRIVIDGGSATGSTRLAIANTGHLGAQTTGNGIQLVAAIHGASTEATAFALNGASTVSAGAYDYTLVRNSNASWYLTSDLMTPPPTTGTPTPTQPPTSTPAAPPGASEPLRVPNYRQEVSLYTAVPSLAVLHSAATTDSWHERIGAAGAGAGLDDRPSRLWLRLVGQSGKRSGDAVGVYGSNGPAYEHRTTGLQLGGDLLRERHANGSQSAGGLFVATGRSTGDVRHFDDQRAGTVTLDVSTVGGYWTWMGAEGAYVDLLAQGNHYSVSAASTRMAALKSSGSGYELSAEGGLPYRLGTTAWRVEPQLQLRALSADLGSGHDAAGRVQFGDADSLVGRAGLRVSHQGGTLTAWTRLDLFNEFKGRSRTTVSTLAGKHAADFSSSVHGRSLGLTAGLDARLTESLSLYGAVSYRRALGDSRGSAWGGQAGVKVAW